MKQEIDRTPPEQLQHHARGTAQEIADICTEAAALMEKMDEQIRVKDAVISGKTAIIKKQQKELEAAKEDTRLAVGDIESILKDQTDGCLMCKHFEVGATIRPHVCIECRDYSNWEWDGGAGRRD